MEKRIKKLFDRLPTLAYALMFIVVLLFVTFSFQGCADQCETTRTYNYYEPVYTTLAELRDAVEVISPQPIAQTGKIYFKSNHLFISEPDKGIHVIDNTDPSNPNPIAFINIPGTSDLAAKGNFLYADSYIDLVVFDISDLQNIRETNRVEDVFDDFNNYGYYLDPTLGLVTGWELKQTMEVDEGDCDQGRFYPHYYYDMITMEGGIAFASDAQLGTPIGSGSAGIAGSMATFTIYDDYLYSINDSDLTIVDIQNQSSPLIHARQNIGWGIETLFPYGDKLFIGSNSGMYIYDNVNPRNPVLLSTYEHIRSCDPVVVEGDYAYVTLRSGTNCQGFSNQLEVVNISDLSNPTWEATYPMFNPHGLGIDNSTLFVCDGDAGLKIYDASDIHAIDDHMKKQYGDINAVDVIPFNNVLMMIGEDGIAQYDYSDLDNIKLLSLISLTTND